MRNLQKYTVVQTSAIGIGGGICLYVNVLAK